MKNRALWIVLSIALALRVAGLFHSLPYRYVMDTHVVRGALGMAQEKTLAPPPNKYTSYPYLLPMALLPQYGVLFAAGKVTGEYRDAQDFGNKMIDDPTPLYWIARILTTLLGLLCVLWTYQAARLASVERGVGLLAAYLVGTSLMLVHLGKDTRPWVAVAAFVALTGLRALRWQSAPTWKNALWMGGAAGLAIASHQAGGLAVLIVAAAVIARIRALPAISIRAGVVSAIAFGVVALLVGFPYLIRGISADVAVTSGGETAGQFDLGGQSVRTEVFGLARFKETILGFIGFEPALVLLVLLAIVWLVRKKIAFAQGALPIVLGYPAVVFLIFVFYGGTHTRYLTPAIPLLAIAGAAAARTMLASGAGVRVAAIVLLALPLVQCLRLDYLLCQVDTRTAFLAQVASNVKEGSIVAVEGYGPPLRFDASAIERLTKFEQWTSRLEQREAAGESPRSPTRPPYSVVPLERFYEFASAWPQQWLARGTDKDHPIEKPVGEFLAETGVQYLVTVDRKPGAPRNSALDAVLAARGEKVAELLPYSGKPPGEAMLPMDPEFAATAIWNVDRPGPALALWRLRLP